MSAISAADFDALVRDHVPFVGSLGVRTEILEPGRAVIRLPYREDLLRPGGTITGPAMMALADIVLYALVLSRIGPKPMAVTTSMNINFLRRPKPGDILAEGRLLKLGRRLAVGEVALFSEGEEEPVAHVTGTYALPPEGK